MRHHLTTTTAAQNTENSFIKSQFLKSLLHLSKIDIPYYLVTTYPEMFH